MNHTVKQRLNVTAVISALLLLAVGLAFTVGGLQLVTVGGTFYYLVAGQAMVVAAGLLVFNRRRSAQVYAVMMLGTIVWALWEVGFSAWELLPRLVFLLVLGLLYRLPGNRGVPPAVGNAPPRWKGARFAASAALLAVAAGAGLHLLNPRPADPLYVNGTGAASAPVRAQRAQGQDWPYYGNDAGGSRFAPLEKITPDNVAGLRVAWTYQTGMDRNGDWSPLEVTPLKIGNKLYLCTGYNDIIALDADTGAEAWRYRSGLSASSSANTICRGVAHYRVPGATGRCASRIITNTIDARLIAVDAEDGRLCESFGDNGETNLLTGIKQEAKGYYFVTSAPTVVGDKIVIGGYVADGQYFGEPSGVIRAYSAETGRFVWAFDAGRPGQTGEPGPGEFYTHSTPNAWAPMSADEALGLVYVPTGNSAPDYFGGQRRSFDEAYSSSVVALDVNTGSVRWSFQTVHHDLWDYDVASQPTLVDIPDADTGVLRQALVQATKRGDFFVLDRKTGDPIRSVIEKPAPQAGAVPEERLSPTQPFSVEMPSIRGPLLEERAMWGLTPFDQMWCRIQFRSNRYEGIFTPPGLERGLYSPMRGGGSNWGGVSVDLDRHLLIANGIRMISSTRLMPRAEADAMGLRPDPAGKHGGGLGGTAPQAGTPYAAATGELMSALGVPCHAPPYATLSAIDLRTGKLVWTKPHGTAENNGPFGIPTGLPVPFGVQTFGGALTTRSGLTFIGASADGRFRAIESETGKQRWSVKLPAASAATPMTYLDSKGRQVVVAVASGHTVYGRVGGDYVVAYALEE